MTSKIIPAIGTAGSYELLTPYDTKINASERYILKSVRKISEYLAQNENVKDDIYVANEIESVYEDHLKEDMEILGLQSDKGGWIYVPATHVKCYPNPNGIPYRAISLVVPLQPIPANTDLTGLLSQINDAVLAVLGFPVNIKAIESSKPILVSSDDHSALQIDRAINKSIHTPAGTIARLRADLAVVQDKVVALEDYILAHP